MSMKIIVGLCTIAYLTTVPMAQAQVDNSRVTVFAGGSFLGGEKLMLVDDDEPFRSEFNNGIRWGARFTVDLDSNWSGEVSYGFSKNNLDITDLGLPAPREREFETNVHQFVANLLYSFRQLRYGPRPFVTAGLGWSRFSPTSEARTRAVIGNFLDRAAVIEADNQFNFNFGGGLEGRLSDRFGFRVDLRDHVTGMPRFGLPKEPLRDRPFFPVDGAIHNVELSGGLVIHLFE